jgi:hypothetical protein
MSAEDYTNYSDNGIPPTEFVDNVNKMVYKRGTQKYNEIYNEFLTKKDTLKASKSKSKTGTSTLKNKFNEALEKINKQEKEELDALAKSKIRADIKTFETNNINLTDVDFIKSQLEPEQYVELKYPEAPNLNKIFFLDKDGVLKYDDVNGVPVTDSDLDFAQSGAYEASVFNYTEDVDPELKKEIQDKYQKQRDEILQNYNKDITYEGEEGEFTPIPDNVTGQQIKEEHNSFYQKEIMPLFNAYLEETYDQNDRLGIFEEEENEILTEFIKTPKIAAIIKAYNIKNSPVEDKEDYILDFKGVKTDTSKASIDDLKALIIKIENEIESLKNNTATDFSKNIIELETELTNLRGVIKGRAQKKYTPEQKAAIENVKRLQALNKKSVEAGIELPSDDPVTGLKKGAIAYRINGKFHRRVSNVVEKLKKEGYSYTSEQDVREAYAETIGVKGLTNDSVDKFIDELIKKNIAGSEGVFFEKLRSRLKSMVVIPVNEKIKTLQKQLVELINKREKAVADDEDKKVSDYTKQIDKLNDDIALLEMGQSNTDQSDIAAKKADITERKKKSFSRRSNGGPAIGFNYSTDSGQTGTYYASDGTSTPIEAPTEKEVKQKLNDLYNAELAALEKEIVTEEPVVPGQNKKNHDDIVEILESRLVVKGVINQIEGSTGVSISLDYWDKNKKVIFYNHDRTITPEDYGSQVELKLIENYKVGDKIFKNVVEVRQGDRVLGLVAETDYVTPKEEKDLVEDVLELISENTYADSRTAGNYIDKAVKDLFSKGQAV